MKNYLILLGAILLLAALVSGCGGGGGGGSNEGSTTGTINVLVTDSTGKIPIPSAQITVDSNLVATTNDEGKCTVSGVKAGDKSLAAIANKYYKVTKTIRVESGKNSDVSLKLISASSKDDSIGKTTHTVKLKVSF